MFSIAGKLHHILDELCNTEMNYLNTLEIINKNFRVALEPHLDKDTLKCIFINVQQLESFHKKLLSSLRGLLGQKKYEVSNCFTIYMDQFALYSEYASKVGRNSRFSLIRKRIKAKYQLRCTKFNSPSLYKLS